MVDVRSDYDNDYTLFDGVEDVSLVPIDATGGPNESAKVENVKAIRSRISDRAYQLFGSIAIYPTDLPWIVWESTLGGKVAEPGCIIIDVDGNRYNVLSVVNDGIVFECLTRQIRDIV